MKSIINLKISGLLVCLALSLGSCEKQKDPSIILLNGRHITTSQVISPGEDLAFRWRAEKGGADLSSFTLQSNGTDWYGYPKTDIPSDIYIDSVHLEGPATAGQFAFSFIITDKEDRVDEQVLTLTVEAK